MPTVLPRPDRRVRHTLGNTGLVMGLLTAAIAATPSPSLAQSTPPNMAAMPAVRRASPADVAFVQGMIGHHAQALEMSALIAERTPSKTMHLLGERITVSQRDEIAMMSEWLRVRGETVPAVQTSTATSMNHDAMSHDMSHAMMPGMLTAAQMDTLRAARGTGFDTLFLRYMIQHHEGAILMVKQLLGTQGAAQEPQLYGFASDVDTDQRAEIKRMQALIRTMSAPRKR